ncbi:hypothetical protein FNF29_03872 [Cafeteria roenbergensis]|uniref:histidine kinase n=1 Tax=Cafeteria roenbergensis TaxID=33653 RepID=A0A5A8CH38_CAFRO|nr:hypothetical protein FNF29_03872 [Cafeteria roenbergensis]|eukprot:KAA0152306.1 hypothetical protein FNF29_03872 [Cafeteria roenbergensis]
MVVGKAIPLAAVAVVMVAGGALMAALYPAEFAASRQASFRPRAASIFKIADRSFAATLAAFQQATAGLRVLGGEGFSNNRSAYVASTATEFSIAGIATSYATVIESTFAGLVADLPAMSAAYGAEVSISGWDEDGKVVSIAPGSRPPDEPVAYYKNIADTTPTGVLGLDVYTEPRRAQAVRRAKALNAAIATAPTSISTTGLPSIQIYGAAYSSDISPAGKLILAPYCEPVGNSSAHQFLGWGIVPVTLTTLINSQLGSEVVSEDLQAVGEDVTDAPQFAWAREQLEAANPCGSRLSLPSTGTDAGSSLILSILHHFSPICDEGNTLFVVEAGEDAPSSFGEIAARCRGLADEIQRLRDASLTPKENLTVPTNAALHMGMVIQFAGRFWSITMTTTKRWEETHPGPSFPLSLRLLLVAVVGLGLMATIYTCLERQEGAIRAEEARRKAIRKRAAAANEAHSQTLSYVAHEVRNPAHVQLATAELMEDYITDAMESAAPETLEDPALQGIFDMLKKDAETLRSTSQVTVRLVSDLLDLTKLKSGRLSVVLRGNRVSSMLSEAVERHAAMADPAVRVEWRVGAGVPQYLLSDGLRVSQVLNNGLSNAAKFCRKGFITVTATLEWRFAPRAFFRQMTKAQRRERKRAARLEAERAKQCWPRGRAGPLHTESSSGPGSDRRAGRRTRRLRTASADAGQVKAMSSKSDASSASDSDSSDEGDDDDISTDPLGIIDVDGSGEVPDVVSYLPLPAASAASTPHTPRRDPIGVLRAGMRTSIGSGIVEDKFGTSALRVVGDLPLNATAAPADMLDLVDPGLWSPPLQPTAPESTLAAGPVVQRRRAASVGQHGRAGTSVSPAPGPPESQHRPPSPVPSRWRRGRSRRAAASETSTEARQSDASTFMQGRRAGGGRHGVVSLVKDDASAAQHFPDVSSDAVRSNARAASRRRIRFAGVANQKDGMEHRRFWTAGGRLAGASQPAQGPTSAVSVAASLRGSAHKSPPAAAAAAAAAAGSEAGAVATDPSEALTPAQGSADGVIPASSTAEELGFHVMRLPKGGKVYARHPRPPPSATRDGRSQMSAVSGDAEVAAQWLAPPAADACPLVPFQAPDGRWAMPFVVFRVVNTGHGLRGKSMRELFAPYSSGADEDPGKASREGKARKPASKSAPALASDEEVGSTRHAAGDHEADDDATYVAASRNAQASRAATTADVGGTSAAPTRVDAGMAMLDDPTAADEQLAAAAAGPPSPSGASKGREAKDKGSFAARVRSTGLGLGIAARLAFSMGATIRLFDAERDAMQAVASATGISSDGAHTVVYEGIPETARRPGSAGRPVTVFEVALPVCPPSRLPRAQDDVPDEALLPESANGHSDGLSGTPRAGVSFRQEGLAVNSRHLYMRPSTSLPVGDSPRGQSEASEGAARHRLSTSSQGIAVTSGAGHGSFTKVASSGGGGSSAGSERARAAAGGGVGHQGRSLDLSESPRAMSTGTSLRSMRQGRGPQSQQQSPQLVGLPAGSGQIKLPALDHPSRQSSSGAELGSASPVAVLGGCPPADTRKRASRGRHSSSRDVTEPRPAPEVDTAASRPRVNLPGGIESPDHGSLRSRHRLGGVDIRASDGTTAPTASPGAVSPESKSSRRLAARSGRTREERAKRRQRRDKQRAARAGSDADADSSVTSPASCAANQGKAAAQPPPLPGATSIDERSDRPAQGTQPVTGAASAAVARAFGADTMGSSGTSTPSTVAKGRPRYRFPSGDADAAALAGRSHGDAIPTDTSARPPTHRAAASAAAAVAAASGGPSPIRGRATTTPDKHVTGKSSTASSSDHPTTAAFVMGQPIPRPRKLPPMRVLLVDDDNSVREITARMLRRLGCSVDALTDGVYVESFLRKAGDIGPSAAGKDPTPVAAATASSFVPRNTRSLSPTGSTASGAHAASDRALALGTSTPVPSTPARANRYDVIFLDIVMPRLSGDVVARTLIQKHGMSTPIFACSGNALPADLERYRQCGFSGIAAKPFSLAALKAKLFEVAAAKELSRSHVGLAAGKPAPLDVMAIMGSGPGHSGLAETELFAAVAAHVLREA